MLSVRLFWKVAQAIVGYTGVIITSCKACGLLNLAFHIRISYGSLNTSTLYFHAQKFWL
jgi:hypothetical protein